MFTDKDGVSMKSAWKDEQEQYSTPRLLLWIWTTLIIYEVLFNFQGLVTSNPFLAFLSGVYICLCGWAGGSKVASYLFPQLGAIVSGIGQAKNVETSSDVQEIYEKTKKTLIKG